MSHDLTTLGIASQNMVPNMPSLDSRPLFQAALTYASSNPVQTLTLDTGAYYLLSDTVDRIYWYSVAGNSWFFAGGAGVSSTVLAGGK